MHNPAQYLARESVLHRTDPRVKLIAVLALSLALLNTASIGLLFTALFLLAVALSSKISPLELLLTTRPVWAFFAILFLVYLLTTAGNPLFSAPGLEYISREGLYLGIVQLSRFFLLFIAASLLTMTTPLAEITLALEYLLRPLRLIKISSHNVALMVSMALRFIPLLLQELKVVQEASAARGADFKGSSLRDKMRFMVYLSTPLLLNIMRRCDQLTEAMDARGYQYGTRTYLYDLTFSRTDYYALGLIAVITVVLWYVG